VAAGAVYNVNRRALAVEAAEPDAAKRMNGDTVVDVDGREVGHVVDVYIDDQTGLPAYAALDTGMSGGRWTVVPLVDAEFMGNRLRISHEKAVVVAAPTIDVQHGRLPAAEAAEVDRYYNGRMDADHSPRPR
jgi:hypothetical protein